MYFSVVAVCTVVCVFTVFLPLFLVLVVVFFFFGSFLVYDFFDAFFSFTFFLVVFVFLFVFVVTFGFDASGVSSPVIVVSLTGSV